MDIFPRQPKVAFLSKLALSLTNSAYSFANWNYIAIYIYSQIQIFSILVMTYLLILPNEAVWVKEISRILYLISSFGDSWSIDNNSSVTLGVLIVISCFLLSEIFSVMFLTALNMLRKSFFSVIVKYLKITIDIHYRILFYPIHLIGTSVLSNTLKLEENPFPTETIRVIFLILVIMGLLWNFIYSMSTLLVFSPKIKSRNPLCTHTVLIDALDLVFKTVSPVYWFLDPMTSLFDIFLSGINLIYFIYRDWVLFTHLPYYKILVLNLTTKIHAFLTTVTFGIICSKLITFSRAQNAFTFLCLVTCLMSPMLISIYAKHMLKILANVPINISKIKPYHLIHYWDIWRYVSSKSKVPSLLTQKVDEKYIYQHIIKTESLNIKGRISEDIDTSLDRKSAESEHQHIFDIYMNLLRASIKRGSSKSLLTACLAKECLKSEKFFVLADDLIREGIKSSPISFKFTFYLLRAELLQKLNKTKKQLITITGYKSYLDNLDIDIYIRLNDKLEILKRSIAGQLQTQITFWKKYQAQEPDCNLLMNLSKEVFSKASQVKQEWVSLRNEMSIQFKDPLLIYGCYLSFVQNDSVSGDQLLREYERLRSCDLELDNRSENKMNMKMLSDSISITVSGSSTKFWKVLDCSNNIENLLGFSKDMVVGQSISLILPSLNHEHLHKHFENAMKAGNPDTSRQICALDKEGYLVLCKIYVTFKFFNNYELSYYIVLNVQKDDNVTLVQTNQSGEIINFSRTFALDIGLTHKEKDLNIFSMCPDLKRFRSVSFNSSENKNQTKSLKKSSILKTEKFVKYGKAEKIIQLAPPASDDAQGLFKFSLPSNDQNFVVYKVKMENFLYEDDIFIQMFLTRVDGSKMNTLQDHSESFQNNFNNNHKASFSPYSFKKVSINDKALTLSPKLQRISTISPTNRISLGKSIKNLSIPKGNNDSEARSVNLLTNETNMLNSPHGSSTTLLVKFTESSKEKTVEKTGITDKLQTLRGDLEENISESVSSKPIDLVFINRETKMNSNGQERSTEQPAEVSKGSYSSKNKQKVYKEIYQILQEKKHKKPVIIYNFLFFLSMIVQLVSLVWLNFMVLQASQETANLNQSLEATFMRTHWINVANQETRYLFGLRNGFFHGWSLETETTVINMTFNKLTKQNQVLINLVMDLPEKIQMVFFEKNINLYERDNQQNLELVALDNSFQVVDKIVTHGFRNIYKTTNLPEFFVQDLIDEDSQFIFDNSLDDLLIVSERLITVVEEEIMNVLTRTKMTMKVFFSVSIVLLGVFFFSSIKFLLELNRNTERFMKLFLSVPDSEAKNIETRIVILSHMVQKNSKNHNQSDPVNLYSRLKKLGEIHHSCNYTKISKKSPSSHSLKQIKSRNWISLIELSIILIIFVVFMLVYYFKVLNQIQAIAKHQVNFNTALENIKTESSVMAQINALVMDNATTTFRHEPILKSLPREIAIMKAISDIKEGLADNSGQLSEKQLEILFNLSCTKAYSADYILLEPAAISICDSISKGSGYLGLLNLLSELSNSLVEYVLEFENSDRNLPTLVQLYEKLPAFKVLHDATMTFLWLSFEATVEEFQDLVNRLKDQRTLFSWIAVLISVVLASIVWVRAMRRLIQRVFEPQDMLKMFPPKLIYKMPHVKKYLDYIQVY